MLRAVRIAARLGFAIDPATWDVIIDNPTTFPRWVRTAGEVLKGRTDQYVFISTLSVYDKWNVANMDEAAPLATMPNPTSEDMQYYGAMKVLAEKESEKWHPGKVTVIRPGLIVGPGDETDRFTYWPVRIAKGGEVLCPPPGDAASAGGTWRDRYAARLREAIDPLALGLAVRDSSSCFLVSLRG